MNAIGLCRHNNLEVSCPSCIRGRAALQSPRGWRWQQNQQMDGWFSNIFKPITITLKPVLTKPSKPPVIAQPVKPPVVQQPVKPSGICPPGQIQTGNKTTGVKCINPNNLFTQGPVKPPVVVQQPVKPDEGVKSLWQDYFKSLPPYDSRGWPLGSRCYSGKIEVAIAKPDECYRPYAEYLKSQEVKKRPVTGRVERVSASSIFGRGFQTVPMSGTMGSDCGCGPMNGDCGCGTMNGTMGAAPCPEGYYQVDIFGLKQCVPTGGTLLKKGQEAGTELLQEGVVGSRANIEAAKRVAKQTAAEKLVDFWDKYQKPIIWTGVAALALGGLGAFGVARTAKRALVRG